MKKVLAIVLALAMILGSFSFVAAASTTNYSDVAGTKYEGAVAVLEALDIVAGYPDGTYKPEKVVTRAEMCKLIICLLGMDDYIAGSYAGYPDVAGSHWASSYIAYAVSLGIVEGYPDGTFRPENPVTYQEASSMLVRALGYQDEYLVGTWPASHVNVAMSEGILDGVTATAEGANRGDIALMLYNALTCDMVQYNALGSLIYSDTIMERLGAVEVKEAIIDEDLAHDALKNMGIDLSGYVGSYVDYYWMDLDKDGKYDSADGECIIVVAEELSTILTGKYEENGTDADTFTVGDTVYKFSNDTVTEAAVYAEFFNGIETYTSTTDDAGNATTTGDDSYVAMNDGDTRTLAVKLSGIYIKEIYSMTQWKAADEVQWDEDYADILASKDKISGYEFKMTSTDEIDYTWLTLVGVEDLAAIPEDAIVTLYTDYAGDAICKIGVSTDTITGKVTKVATVNSATVYTIDGEGYKLSSVAADYANPALGNNGTYYLNYEGKLSVYVPDDYVGNYAIVMDDTYEKTSYGSSDTYQLYLMTKDGEKTVYDFDSDEGSKYYTGGSYASVAVANNLVEFDTNSDGELTVVTDTAITQTATTLTSKGVLDGKLIADEVAIFMIYASAQKDWRMGSLDELKTGDNFTGAGVSYAVNSDGKVDVIVVTADTNVKTVTNLGIFTDQYVTYDDDNDKVYGGTVLISGAETDYITTSQSVDTSDTGIIYKLSYKGSAIKEVTQAVDYATDVPLDDFTSSYNYAVYTNNGTAGTDYTLNSITATDFDTLYKVVKKSGSTLDLGMADDENTTADEAVANYQYIGEATNIYKVALTSSGAYKCLEVGSISEITADSYVMLLQMDEDTGAWDTIIYVTDDDAAKLGF